jgi:hypothetical protein
LSERSPVDGFSGEHERLAFSEHLAARLRRPALHDALVFDFPRSLGQYIKSTAKSTPEWWQNVEGVRLLIKGDRLRPTAVQVLIVEQLELSASERKVWRDWLKIGRATLRPHQISLGYPIFSTMEKLPASLYAASVPLNIPELGRPKTF